jgi:hypothetical protein
MIEETLFQQCWDNERRVRDLINEPRLRQVLLNDLAKWFQLCSSLDVLGDTSMAVHAYTQLPPEKDSSKLYLFIYGLFQALFLQQDALSNMCEAVGVEFQIEDHPDLMKIRAIRNCAIGHPTKKDRPKPTTFHFISRATMSLEYFDMHTASADGIRGRDSIAVKKLIEEQMSLVITELNRAAEVLEQRDKEHREKFRMDKLANRFPETTSYFFEKIFAGTRGDAVEIGQIGVGQIENIISDFKKALEARGLNLDTYDSIKHLYIDLEYPMEQLRSYFASAVKKEARTIDSRAAEIFTWFVEHRLKELKHIAEEIDAEYAK